MAGISHDKETGRRTIQFVGQDGKRRSIRLGRVSSKVAEEVRRRVEYLYAARTNGTAPDPDTVRWLASIGDELHSRLAAVGLVDERQAATKHQLKPFIDAYIAGRTDAKP